MKNILFVSHDASRSGAPIVLLNFLRWLKQNKTYSFSILLKSGGDMIEQFQEVAPTYNLNFTSKSYTSRIIRKVKSLISRQKTNRILLSTKLKKEKFDLIYLNTVLSLDLTYSLTLIYDCPVVVHIHENEFATKFLYPNGFNQKDVNSITKFIVVSQSTATNLITNYNIPIEKISIVYPFTLINKKRIIDTDKSNILKSLEFEGNFIIGGSGECNWRKGVDLFIQLAVYLNKLRPDNQIKLLWLGHYTHEFSCQIDYELKRLKVNDMVKFIGSKPDPQNYFQIFDLFTLTSREDPFPLVALEAAAMQKPVIYFNNAGGISELFKDDIGGIKVSYGNTEDMAKKILFLLDNKDILLQKGVEACNLIQNYDVDHISTLLVELIASTMIKNNYT